MKLTTFGVTITFLLLLGGCTAHNSFYRTAVGEKCEFQIALALPVDAKTFKPTPCPTASVEKIEIQGLHPATFDISYVELTDQGLFYQRKQLTEALNLLQGDPKQVLNVVVFIHGWKNSAASDNLDVQQFRHSVMPILAAARPDARTVGIYVGWRGAVFQGRNLAETLSIYDRKVNADHVARGSTRELFAHLQALRNDRTREVKLTMIGHSFGALILYNAVSGSLVNSVVSSHYSNPSMAGQAAPIADMILLLNPAFEATRFEPLFQAAKDHPQSALPKKYAPNQRPLMVSITSETDGATKTAFPIARSIISLLEVESVTDQDPVPLLDRSQRVEKLGNTHTVGHLARYRTHELAAVDDKAPATCTFNPQNPSGSETNHFPLWTMLAKENVINGHHDIYKPNLWEFVAKLSNSEASLDALCSKPMT